ncbi:hypothetical protein QTI51_03880 [Variovorax sp. J22G73]|uniref:hypothetical protein n=1 Tax=unclassified Variovorax TaxID=663243 RepID=UPI002574BA0C|nr:MULTISPECIES: hypothetical protein [unclassified Variovorax]MDM0003933.1 hypothetical protein [Variovorax sp. J22R203]MDM0096401.1 hypothetical protein [Variovorax sp. J22G73]
MKERPILFSAPMVRALLDGTKTQTRRMVKPPRGYRWLDLAAGTMVNTGGHKMHRSDLTTPYGQPGDRLWVREAWATHAFLDDVAPRKLTTASVHYSADGTIQTGKGRPSIHMPRKYSRIDLEVTGVRVERLQDISASDAKAEGIEGQSAHGPWRNYGRDGYWFPEGKDTAPVLSYRSLWDQINGPDSWAANPWVWVVEFRAAR